MLIGILVQFSISAPPSRLALDIQPGLVLHDRLLGLKLWVKFLSLEAFAPEQEQPPDLSHHISLCPAPAANKRDRNFLLCLSFSPYKSCSSLCAQISCYLEATGTRKCLHSRNFPAPRMVHQQHRGSSVSGTPEGYKGKAWTHFPMSYNLELPHSLSQGGL